MLLTLKRSDFRADGIFGVLLDERGEQIAVTLEHAFPDILGPMITDTIYLPVLLNGIYRCERGDHKLESMNMPFETFEVLQVPSHSGILFHMGNYNKDSQGCILLGREIVKDEKNPWWINYSLNTFGKFMSLCEGHDSFTLNVG